MSSSEDEQIKPKQYTQEIESESESLKSSSSDEFLHAKQAEKLQKMIDKMDEKELHRYESFRRSGFSKNTIRKLVSSVLNQACNPNFLISISGIAKVFAGEMIEEALNYQNELGNTGPLKPFHIHEAYRRLYKKMPNMKMFNKSYF